MGREVKRVALDFDWPLGETWAGYLNPFADVQRPCKKCGGSGYSPEAKRLSDQWYGQAPFLPAETGSTAFTDQEPAVVELARRNVMEGGGGFALENEVRRLLRHYNSQWMHHLDQDDVDALLAASRLWDFTSVPRTDAEREIVRAKVAAGGNCWLPGTNGYVPTAAEVNRWSLIGMGHDSINHSVCVKAKARRLRVPLDCRFCRGEGSIWPNSGARYLSDAWQNIEPPAGDGWQMWQTTSEGGPISIVCKSAEALARWLADSGASAFGRETATYDEWLAMIRAGSAPSMIAGSGEVLSGVAAVAKHRGKT